MSGMTDPQTQPSEPRPSSSSSRRGDAIRLGAVALVVAALVYRVGTREPSDDLSTEVEAEDLRASPPTAEATIIAEDQAFPVGLAIDDAYVYWGDGPRLMRAPKRGGSAEVLHELGTATISSIAVDADVLYFGASGGGVFRLRRGESRPERIGTSGNPRSLVVDDTHVLWYDGGLRSVSKDAPGGASAPETITAGNSAELLLDDASLYWHGGARIWRRDVDGGPAEPIASTGHLWTSLAMDDTHLYWGDDIVDGVLRWPKAGGPLEHVTSHWSYGANLIVDGDWLLVVEIDSRVWRVDKRDGRSALLCPRAVHTIGASSIELAVDEEQLFIAIDASTWKNPGGGMLHIDLTKPGAQLPEVIPRGVVARLPKQVEGLSYRPRPAEVVRATVYFSEGQQDPQDHLNALRWLVQAPTVDEAVRAGRLPVMLIVDADGALSQRRAEVVTRTLRERVGHEARIEVVSRPGIGDVVMVALDRDGYANLWAASPPRARP